MKDLPHPEIRWGNILITLSSNLLYSLIFLLFQAIQAYAPSRSLLTGLCPACAPFEQGNDRRRGEHPKQLPADAGHRSRAWLRAALVPPSEPPGALPGRDNYLMSHFIFILSGSGSNMASSAPDLGDFTGAGIKNRLYRSKPQVFCRGWDQKRPLACQTPGILPRTGTITASSVPDPGDFAEDGHEYGL